MKIWKLHIYWGDDDLVDFVSIMLFGRIMSRLDLERIKKYANGGFHVHRNPRKKEEKIKGPPLTVEEIGTMVTDMGKQDEPRHTPEELDRLVEAVRKVESP